MFLIDYLLISGLFFYYVYIFLYKFNIWYEID